MLKLFQVHWHAFSGWCFFVVTGVESGTKHISIDSAVWRCPICTYDNEEDMPCCDICGVFRNPLVKSGNNSNVTQGMCSLLDMCVLNIFLTLS